MEKKYVYLFSFLAGKNTLIDIDFVVYFNFFITSLPIQSTTYIINLNT